MNPWIKISAGVGRKLLLSIGVILFFTVISVLIASVAINKINSSQEMLTNSSIPALVDVNHLSGIAVNIIQESLLMSSANNIFSVRQENE